MGGFCRVVVDVPTRALFEPFDYAVPPGMEAVALVGAPVVVPLAGARRTGWIVERVGQPACDPASVKPLADVTGQPLFDDVAAKLALWVADRYLAPPSEALRLCLPPGQARPGAPARVGPLTEEWAELAMAPEAALDAVGTRAKKQRALVERLAQGAVRSRDLVADAGAGRPALVALATKGLVKLSRREVERPVVVGWAGPLQGAPTLEGEQEDALARLVEHLVGKGGRADGPAARGHGEPRPVCLEGVTGSGKSEVYMRLIEAARARGLGAIVLVPEISLTPQTVSRFVERFGDSVAVLHSRLTPGERFDQWRSVASGARTIVVGARSALFAPVRPLGVVVLDEEHDGSFKQESSPRYHARETAIELGRLSGATVVLGSATPSVETIRYVEEGNAERLHLSRRVAGRPLPEMVIADMAAEFRSGNRSILSEALRSELERCLAAREKAILLINRRGWAGFLLCRDCGHVPSCPLCAVSLTVHSGGKLRCHHCGHREGAPAECPVCDSPFLRTFGIGTQRVEEVLELEFPGARVVRMDADTTKGRRGHERTLATFVASDSGILLGTQMVAKGHDFPEVTLVGVVAADLALHLPDFRAAERTYQLLHQVAGRAGRGDVPGRVVIQTYCPDHYAIASLPSWRIDDFYEQELAFRRALAYPPFAALVNLLISGREERTVRDAAAAVVAELGAATGAPGSLEVMGPSAAALARLQGQHRWQVVVRASDGAELRGWLAPVARRLRARLPGAVSLAVDVDPLGMM